MQVIDLSTERAKRTINAAMKLFVVEYSIRENAVMIRTLDNVVRDNIKNVKKALIKDYLPVGVFPSRSEADRFHAHLNVVLAEEEHLPLNSRDWERIGNALEQALQTWVDLAEK